MATADQADFDDITRLLGRAPEGAFTVVVRGTDGKPLVIRNAPFLADGRPMPTRYWLVGAELRVAVGRLESEGGVRRAGAAVDPAELEGAHRRYAALRDADIAAGHAGPRPYGGVGGTRQGVKCLHIVMPQQTAQRDRDHEHEEADGDPGPSS